MKTVELSAYHSKWESKQTIKVNVEDVSINDVLKAVVLKMIKVESGSYPETDKGIARYPIKITILPNEAKPNPEAAKSGIKTPEGSFTTVRLDYSIPSHLEDYYISISSYGANEWIIDDELKAAKDLELSEESLNSYLDTLKGEENG